MKCVPLALEFQSPNPGIPLDTPASIFTVNLTFCSYQYQSEWISITYSQKWPTSQKLPHLSGECRVCDGQEGPCFRLWLLSCEPLSCRLFPLWNFNTNARRGPRKDPSFLRGCFFHYNTNSRRVENKVWNRHVSLELSSHCTQSEGPSLL